MEFVGKVAALIAAVLFSVFIAVTVAEVFGILTHLVENGFMKGWNWDWIQQ